MLTKVEEKSITNPKWRLIFGKIQEDIEDMKDMLYEVRQGRSPFLLTVIARMFYAGTENIPRDLLEAKRHLLKAIVNYSPKKIHHQSNPIDSLLLGRTMDVCYQSTIPDYVLLRRIELELEFNIKVTYEEAEQSVKENNYDFLDLLHQLNEIGEQSEFEMKILPPTLYLNTIRAGYAEQGKETSCQIEEILIDEEKDTIKIVMRSFPDNKKYLAYDTVYSLNQLPHITIALDLLCGRVSPQKASELLSNLCPPGKHIVDNLVSCDLGKLISNCPTVLWDNYYCTSTYFFNNLPRRVIDSSLEAKLQEYISQRQNRLSMPNKESQFGLFAKKEEKQNQVMVSGLTNNIQNNM